MAEKTLKLPLDVVVRTTAIVAAYVSRNHVAVADVPALIARVHTAITDLASPKRLPRDEPLERPDAARIRKSVRHEALVSFIDGKTYKTLKRHLTAHGLDPHSYRTRYGLPADYPMVAPSYSETRSNLAKSSRLGQPGGPSTQAGEIKLAPSKRPRAA